MSLLWLKKKNEINKLTKKKKKKGCRWKTMPWERRRSQRRADKPRCQESALCESGTILRAGSQEAETTLGTG